MRKIHFKTISLHCRDTNMERDHHRTPSECTIRSHPGIVHKHVKTVLTIEMEKTNNLSWIHNIDGKVQPSKQSSSKGKNSKMSNGESFQDPNKESHFKTPNIKRSTHTVKIITYEAILAHFRTKIHDVEEKWQNKLISRPLIWSMMKRVEELNPKYYLLTNEQTKIVSEPARALRDGPQDESTAPLKASRFNQIYVEPGSIQINSTRTCRPCFPTLSIE